MKRLVLLSILALAAVACGGSTPNADLGAAEPGGVETPSSAFVNDLRRTGADLARFPDGIDELATVHSCGVLDVAFEGDRGTLATAIRCLSDQAEGGTAAGAVFVSSTVEGDPIVELWVVDGDRATIFVDSSRDAYGRGSPAWSRRECTVELPLPDPRVGHPDPSEVFTC